MSSTISAKRYRGGARVGLMNVTWPFAGLEVDASHLRLSGLLLGDHYFRPEDVVGLEAQRIIPFLGGGVRILHLREDVPERVIFWHFLPPSWVIDGIRATGFRPNGRGLLKPDRKGHEGLPFKTSVLAVAFVAWNVLFLIDFIRQIPGVPSLVALWGTFAAATLTLRSPSFRSIVLKPGRELGHARNYVRLLQIVVGFIVLGWTLLLVVELSP